MTARAPLNLAGLTREELTGIVRELESTCNAQDAAAQKAGVNLGRMYIDNKKMKETLEKIQEIECNGRAKEIYCTWVDTPKGRMCVHDAAKEVLARVAAK